MATDTGKQDYAAHIVDLLQGMGPVYSRRMFGGYGIFLDGLMFALIADNELYLKVNEETRAGFEALGLAPFTYDRQGRPARLNYYQAPEEALEDMEMMLTWGNRAFSVALQAAGCKKAQGGRKRTPGPTGTEYSS